MGGFDGSTGLNSAEMYDPRTREWRMIAPMSTRRSSVGVGVVNGLLYAVSLCSVMARLYVVIWVWMEVKHCEKAVSGIMLYVFCMCGHYTWKFVM